jgi:hypothetical protein
MYNNRDHEKKRFPVYPPFVAFDSRRGAGRSAHEEDAGYRQMPRSWGCMGL